ncbi:RNAse P Rpr2/Rpp21/SNM1 subunit domain-containing protein [Mycena olivaceomarginata]|nr:RNAse P Rpr2/Rpp21/SNM1 subunit domain-containing protein [Mycena olivaceomarginata]
MAKKNKDETPNANSIVNRDIMQRLNFMYQASVYLSGVLPVPQEITVAPQKRTKKSRKMNVHDLSKSYINSMKTVASKTMVKMDPAVKRTLCNGCNIVLVPGSTATVRVKPSKVHGHVMHYRCTSCNSTRRIPAPPTLTDTAPTSGPSASTAAASQDAAMDTDTIEPSHKKTTKKITPTARLPHLFAREGHVVICGNDKLPETQCGDGVYIT